MNGVAVERQALLTEGAEEEGAPASPATQAGCRRGRPHSGWLRPTAGRRRTGRSTASERHASRRGKCTRASMPIYYHQPAAHDHKPWMLMHSTTLSSESLMKMYICSQTPVELAR